MATWCPYTDSVEFADNLTLRIAVFDKIGNFTAQCLSEYIRLLNTLSVVRFEVGVTLALLYK